jgi:phosphatidylglycerol:prolipoprotein diacylglycerol transferase
MHPNLFEIPGTAIRIGSYGVLLMIGVIVALFLARKRAPQFGIHPDRLYDALFWMLIPGILGARITYIAQNWPYYQAHQNELYSLQFMGLTSFGGMIGGFLGFYAWSRISKTNLWPLLDVVGIPVLVAHAFGRIGCLLNGCCHGFPGDAWYCVARYDQAGRYLGTFAPAQAFDTAMCILFAVVLYMIEKRKSFAIGQSFGMAVAAYGLSRFIYEFWRAGEADKNYVRDSIGSLPLSTGQAMALVLVVVGVVVMVVRRRQPQPEPLEVAPA